MADEDDREDFHISYLSHKYLHALEEMSAYLRQKERYSDNEIAIPFYEEVREKFHEILNDNKIEL